MKQVADALAEVPADEAFLLLLGHADSKHVRPALLEAMRRYPVRALRLLTADLRAPGGTGQSTTRQLLVGHVAAHRALAEQVLPTLAVDLTEIVEPLLNPANRLDDAPVDALLLPCWTAPPWTRQRSGTKPTVVPGLTAVSEPAVEWLPGEKEQWTATKSWYTQRHDKGDWEQEIAALRYGLDAHDLRPHVGLCPRTRAPGHATARRLGPDRPVGRCGHAEADRRPLRAHRPAAAAARRAPAAEFPRTPAASFRRRVGGPAHGRLVRAAQVDRGHRPFVVRAARRAGCPAAGTRCRRQARQGAPRRRAGPGPDRRAARRWRGAGCRRGVRRTGRRHGGRAARG